ncbi:MAG: DegV family protein [Dehalococcoidales bacterium]|nr:DegV family protein [Dehalococcoidales bacterium]
MDTVRIMADTTASLPPDLAKKHNIKIVPAANIIIDGKTYIENVSINTSESYDLIRKDPDNFVTSAITPGFILDAFKELSQETKNILFITISSSLSAVYKSASTAAELFREQSPETNIRIIDSKSVAGGEGLLALTAARAAALSMNLDQVAAAVEKCREQTRCLMILDTLRYIYRTGRMSKMSARIASLFNIRPINKLAEDGTVEMVDRVRNREDGLRRLTELVKEMAPAGNLTFMISHSDSLDMAGKLAEKMKENFSCQDIIIGDYSPVMGYGAGPGAMCLAFHPDLKLF